MNFKKIFSSEISKGSIVLLITMNIFNLLNYLFHFFMARLLTPSDYGVIVVLMSFIYIFGIPSEAIQGIFSKYSSEMLSKKENKKLSYIIKLGVKKILIYTLFFFIITNLLSIFLSKFLKIGFLEMFLINLTMFAIILVSVFRGVLQGTKRFSKLGGSLIIESSFRLGVAILLVVFGMGIFGPIIGLITGFSLGLIISIYSIKDITSKEIQKTDLKEFSRYSFNFFMVMITIVLMYSIDTILARRFFSPDIAGKYAVISMLSKMIFFGTMPISKAMFPLSTEHFSKGKNSKKLLLKCFFGLSFIIIIALLFFIIFPEFIISILFGSKYLEVARYLIYPGIAMGFLALTNLLLVHRLAQGKFNGAHYLFAFIILEVTLLWIFNENLLEYSLALMFSNIIMFIGSLIIIKLKN